MYEQLLKADLVIADLSTYNVRAVELDSAGATAQAMAVAEWMRETTRLQLAELQRLLAASPLRHIRA